MYCLPPMWGERALLPVRRIRQRPWSALPDLLRKRLLPLVWRQWCRLAINEVLGHFCVAQDARRALNGLKGQCGDMSVQPLPEPVDGRSWCLRGDVMDPSKIPAVTMVIERWIGTSSPIIDPVSESVEGR
jgi:hypothetical protein